MKNFDAFIGIDWTGAKSPIHTRAISVARCEVGQNAPTLIKDKWSRQKVGDYIGGLIPSCHRILIGIDCNFGYARSVIETQLGSSASAKDLWNTVEKSCANIPNFFAGNFWTHPDFAASFWTNGKMPKDFQMPRRITETVCGKSGYGWPESPFKLIGAKQVGKGGLAGMRLAYFLKSIYGDDIAIWPFDDDETCDRAQVVITEIYPRQFIKRTGMGNQKIRTTEDLNAALDKLNSNPFTDDFNSDHDTDAIIATAGLRYLCGMGKPLPQGLSNPPANRIELESEGWIFGAGFEP